MNKNAKAILEKPLWSGSKRNHKTASVYKDPASCKCFTCCSGNCEINEEVHKP